jgi:hypothetical protein
VPMELDEDFSFARVRNLLGPVSVNIVMVGVTIYTPYCLDFHLLSPNNILLIKNLPTILLNYPCVCIFLFFFTVKAYNISLIIKFLIHVGISVKIWKLAKHETTFAKLWATLFACLLINSTWEFVK